MHRHLPAAAASLAASAALARHRHGTPPQPSLPIPRSEAARATALDGRFARLESYDPKSDTWQRHAPRPTPRHAVGATAIGEWVHVAGGGAVRSSVHVAFTLA